MAKTKRSAVMVTLAVMALLFASTDLVSGKRTKTLPQDSPCVSNRNATSLAVSIVYAVCNGSVVLAGQSIASAAVSGCGDAMAAGISVSLAAMGAADLEATSYAAFAAALGTSSSVNAAVSVAEALALAIASAPPSIITQADMVEGLAGVVLLIADTNGCFAAKQLARSVGQTFAVTDATGTLLPVFVAALNQSDPDRQQKTCNGLAQAANQAPAKGWKGRFVDRAGGVGLGRVKRPIFCKGIARMRKASSTAVTIAQAACPEGNATLAAIAIAIASTSDDVTTATAIAGVLAAGVDITPLVTTLFLDAASTGKRSSVQALGAAIVACTPEDQVRLLRIVAAALNNLASELGCDPAREQLGALQYAGLSTEQLQQVCFMVYTCTDVCPAPAL